MKRVEPLIDMARKLSQNTRYDSTSGVPQDVFVQFLNNAQDSLIMEVNNHNSKYFKKTSVETVVPGQEAYDYPTDCYMQELDTIQWTDSSTGDFRNLEKTVRKEKLSTAVGYAFGYEPKEAGFYLNPPINSGLLYVTYSRHPKKLQKRAGKVSARTISGANLTALTVDTTEASFDATEINADYYLCVVDKFGAVKASNILYDSVSSTTGVFTLSSFALGAETFSVGDYVVVGKNSINVPELPEICEGYLIKHMVYEAKMGDASAWTAEAKDDMSKYFAKLSISFSAPSDDITNIAVTNLDFLGQ
jgi:hypothetical protein